MSDAQQPTTAQFLTALAASLAPLAGPGGVAVAGALTAVEQIYDSLMMQKALGVEYIAADALGAQAEAAAAVAQVIADRAAQRARLGA